MLSKLFPFVIFFIAFSYCCKAQESCAGKSEISVSAGYFSYDEFKGLADAWNTYADPFAFPDRTTGALFASYRYFVSDNVAIGFTAGYDNQEGDLSTGDEKTTGHSPVTIGRYRRRVYTYSPEVLVKYYGWKGGMMYGTAALGYTDLKTYFDYNVTANPYTGIAYKSYVSDQSHLNMHFTFIGVRLGNILAWNLELGFGFKGLINTGLSFKF